MFLRFLNCTNGTKLRNAPQLYLKILTKNNGHNKELETETCWKLCALPSHPYVFGQIEQLPKFFELKIQLQ